MEKEEKVQFPEQQILCHGQVDDLTTALEEMSGYQKCHKKQVARWLPHRKKLSEEVT